MDVFLQEGYRKPINWYYLSIYFLYMNPNPPKNLVNPTPEASWPQVSKEAVHSQGMSYCENFKYFSDSKFVLMFSMDLLSGQIRPILSRTHEPNPYFPRALHLNLKSLIFKELYTQFWESLALTFWESYTHIWKV